MLYLVLLSLYTGIYAWAPHLWYINYWIYAALLVEIVETCDVAGGRGLSRLLGLSSDGELRAAREDEEAAALCDAAAWERDGARDGVLL